MRHGDTALSCALCQPMRDRVQWGSLSMSPNKPLWVRAGLAQGSRSRAGSPDRTMHRHTAGLSVMEKTLGSPERLNVWGPCPQIASPWNLEQCSFMLYVKRALATILFSQIDCLLDRSYSDHRPRTQHTQIISRIWLSDHAHARPTEWVLCTAVFSLMRSQRRWMTCPDPTLTVHGRATGQPKAYASSATGGCFIPFAG